MHPLTVYLPLDACPDPTPTGPTPHPTPQPNPPHLTPSYPTPLHSTPQPNQTKPIAVRRQAKYDQAVVRLEELQETNAGLQQQCSQVRAYRGMGVQGVR